MGWKGVGGEGGGDRDEWRWLGQTWSPFEPKTE